MVTVTDDRVCVCVCAGGGVVTVTDDRVCVCVCVCRRGRGHSD